MASPWPSSTSSYRLDELGWLQFERVCSLLLAADAGLRDLGWIGHADTGRGEVLVDAGDLDPAEKTLILFRHATARGASRAGWCVRRPCRSSSIRISRRSGSGAASWRGPISGRW